MVASTYKIALTSQELTQRLYEVTQKIDISSISNSIDSQSESDVASSKAVNDLKLEIESILTPEQLLSIIEQAPDYNNFSDSDKEKLNALRLEFRGTVLNITERDLIDVQDYTGREFILVIDDGTGNPVFQYYNVTLTEWINIERTITDRYEIPSAITGDNTLLTFDINNFNRYLLDITVTSSNDFHSFRFDVKHNDNDLYISQYNEVLSNGDLCTVTAELVGTVVSVIVNIPSPVPTSILGKLIDRY